MDLRIDTSEFVERNSPHKSWVRQPLHRNQNLYNRLIRALVADNAEDKFRFPENHPEISKNIKSRVYKKPSIRSDMVIEDFLGKYTEQILDDCAAFRRNNTLWLSCPKSPSLKDMWRKSIIPNQLLLNGYSKKRSRYSSKYLTSESDNESDSPPELTAETYDCFNKQSKKTKISSPHDDDDDDDDDDDGDNYSRLNSKPDEICLSDLNYSRDNNSFNRISESTATTKLKHSETDKDNVDLNNFISSVEPNDNNNNNNNLKIQIPRKPKSTWLNRLVESNYDNIIINNNNNNNQSTSQILNNDEKIYENEENNKNKIYNNNDNNNNNEEEENKNKIDDKKIYDHEDNKIENEVNINIDNNNNDDNIINNNNDNNNSNSNDTNNNNSSSNNDINININNDSNNNSSSNNDDDDDIVNINNNVNNNININNNSSSNNDDDIINTNNDKVDDDGDNNDSENNLGIKDLELLLGDDLLTEKAMHCLLNYYYYQQKDDQFRGCFKIMPLNSSFDDLKKYQKSYRAKHNSDEYVFICIEENQDFYGIILKRLRFKMFFDERVVVLNSNHKYENKYLVKIIQNLQKHINEIDYYSELDYPHQLNRPVSNIYLVYFFKWLTIENLEKLFEDEPCDMPLALTKKNLEILKKDYAKILYNLIPNNLRKLANFNVNDFNDC